MSRRLRISAPPPTLINVGGFDLWANQITDAVNLLPSFSLSSTTNGPNSYVTGDSGTFLIDVGSSNTTFWAKLSGITTSGWTELLQGGGSGSATTDASSLVTGNLPWAQLPTSSGTWNIGSGLTAALTNSSASMLLQVSGDIAIPSGKKFRPDGILGTGDTYWWESSANTMAFVTGGSTVLQLNASQTVFITTFRAVGVASFNDAGIGNAGVTFVDAAGGSSRIYGYSAAPALGFLISAGGTSTFFNGVTINGTTTLAAALTGVLRADAGVVSVAAGVGIKSLFDHFVDANNGTTVETDLYSDTIAAAQLSINGQKLIAQYGGIFTGDATSTQRIKIYFGGTLIFDSGALAIGAATPAWDCYVTIIRVSSSVVRCSVAYTDGFITLPATAAYTEVTGLTLANTQVLKITGQAGGAAGLSNQITAKEGFVQWLPAA